MLTEKISANLGYSKQHVYNVTNEFFTYVDINSADAMLYQHCGLHWKRFLLMAKWQEVKAISLKTRLLR